MIAFKQFDTLDEWATIHPKLREVLGFLHGIWPEPFMVVTRIRVPAVDGESGVHQTIPHRAADIRTHGMTYMAGRSLANRVNAEFSYGKEPFEVAMYHDAGSGYHIHLQVRDETARRPQDVV